MTKLILATLLTISSTLSFAGEIKTKSLVVTGSWKNPSIWNENRLPADGDTVVIPMGTTVIVDDVQHIQGDIFLKIYGVLKFANGKISMGDSSKIFVYETGLILKVGSPAETIRIGNSLKFGKDDETILGPSYTNLTTPESPLAFKAIPGYESALIVRVSGFNAVRKNENVFIQWSTSDESNAYMYELQKSFDGNTWNSIAYISPIGTIDAQSNYSYTDKNVTAKTIYYRLKHVDNRGRAGYTQVKFINSLNEDEIKITSMPQNRVLIQFNENIKGDVEVYLSSIYGKVVQKKAIANPKGQVVFEAAMLIKGTYVVTIRDQQNKNISKQVIF